jgi:acyl-coenzyme A thioesterase PaaI-like protein
MSKSMPLPFPAGGRNCYMCGPDNPHGLKMLFYKTGDREISARITPPSYWNGWDGLVHGGLQCALMDEVTAWAAAVLTDQPTFFTTSLEIKYRRPVRIDQELHVVGRLLDNKASKSRVQGLIMNSDGVVLVEAVARILHVTNEKFSEIIEKAP